LHLLYESKMLRIEASPSFQLMNILNYVRFGNSAMIVASECSEL